MTTNASAHTHVPHHPAAVRAASFSTAPPGLADIYQPNINIAVWQRDLTAQVDQAVGCVFARNPRFEFAMTVTPQDARHRLNEALRTDAVDPLSDNVAHIVDMFCCLFDLNCAGLRMAVLNRAMCPRFHVDYVPCRLVTTYAGVATDWLPHERVDRTKLARGGDGLSDLEAGLYKDERDVQQLTPGDVALLKGELWAGNEGGGLVHRSPSVPEGSLRLVLTLDISRE